MDKIKNFSLRKTIVLYMMISLIISFIFSAFVVKTAETVQNNVWWKYVDQEKYFEIAEGDGRRYLIDVPRPHSYEMEKLDYHISEICDFLQTYTVIIVSVAGSMIAVFLFYKHKLKYPIEELELASQQVGQNNLDFHITYENKDEVGSLCKEFERMRKQLAENNRQLWKMLEEEKAASQQIGRNNLDFHITYENKDEMGRILVVALFAFGLGALIRSASQRMMRENKLEDLDERNHFIVSMLTEVFTYMYYESKN